MRLEKTHCPAEIILFTRYPQPGKVKTRLIPKLGKNEAARIHRNMTEHVISQIQHIATRPQCNLSIYYTGGTEQQMRNWLGESMFFKEQTGHDLGQRMAAAFHARRAHCPSRTILIGSDCPSINTALLTESLTQLRNSDLVIGPAFDGGYYLIGINHSVPDTAINSLFADIPWGTPEVYSKTIARAAQSRLSLYRLQQHHDIDRPEDLEYFNHYPDPQ